MKNLLFVFSFWALLAGTAAAESVYVLEEGLELHARDARFSLSGPGSVTLRSCTSCAPESYQFAATTEFFINNEPAERDRLVALSREGGALYVFYDTQTGKVTRIRLTAYSDRSPR